MSKLSKGKAETWLVPLHETVFIGYTDIAAAGSRALLGVSGNKEIQMFEIPELPSTVPCCTLPQCKVVKTSKDNEKPLVPLAVYNCKYMQCIDDTEFYLYDYVHTLPSYSFVVINTHVPARRGHAVVKYILEACINSYVHRVFLLSALRLDTLEGPVRHLYENTWNGMAPGTNCHPLPTDLKFCDPLLSNFIQMFMIEGIPFSVLIVPAHKAEAGCASERDGSSEVIATMQELMCDITHVGFSLDVSCSLIYDGNPGENEDMVAMIYV